MHNGRCKRCAELEAKLRDILSEYNQKNLGAHSALRRIKRLLKDKTTEVAH